MSRAFTYRSLFAALAAALVVSCGRKDHEVRAFVNVEGPIRIHFTCSGGVDSIGLADANGTPAWTVERQPGKPIVWLPAQNVTINSIRRKNGDPLPLDPDGDQGRDRGKAYKSKVKHDAETDDYRYAIDVTCLAPDNSTRHLIIDPEMIVRRGLVD